MPKSETPQYAAIGERIRNLRRLQDITQVEFGKRIHAAQPTVSQWEKGAKLPGRGMQYRIADYFRVSRSMLFAEAPDGIDETGRAA